MKSKLSVALLWIAVFLMGGIAGAVSHYLYQEHFKAAVMPKAPPTPQDILDGMARELNLDAQQKETLENIFEQSRKRYFDLALQFRPHYEKIRNETDDQIKNMLRNDQRVRYEEFLRKVYAAPTIPPQKPSDK
jgi:uncharacterized membrane protein